MKLLADENLRGQIWRGLLIREPRLELVRVQEVGLTGADDPTVMQWAAEQERVILSHDVNTLVAEAYRRIEQGEPMPGVIAVPFTAPVGRAIEDILLIVGAMSPIEIDGQVLYVPFP